MLQKRLGSDDDREVNDGLAAVETARSTFESSAAGKPPVHGDEKLSIFWRVFGGTILSMVALGAITLYNNIASNIAELRNELNRERDARSELVKKDEFNSRTTSQYDRMRTFDVLKADHEGLKERVNGNAASLDGFKKDVTATLDGLKKDFTGSVDAAKKDVAALEVLKERVANLEPLKKDVAGIELIKERIMSASADFKALREEVAKLNQDVERNKAGDLERKSSRDAQQKQVEDMLKELQKGLQACREKLARIEGSQPATPVRGAFIPFDAAQTGKPAAKEPPDKN